MVKLASQQLNSSADSRQQLAALRCLRSGPLTKSHLAIQTYGADSGSARSMMTRLSGRLIEAGLAQEKKMGRERVMQITELGRRQIERAQGPESVPAIPKLPEVLISHQEHSDDRPRYHLRHAALLALSKLLRQPKRNASDDRYEVMLLALAHEVANPVEDAKRDSEVFDSLSSGWNNADRRKRLMECLVRFEDVVSRRDAGSELVSLGEKVEPGPEAILWSSAAIDLAHHYTFAPASQLDRLTARRLLRQARDLLVKSAADPELATAAAYRLEKASKVASLGWTPSGVRVDIQPAAGEVPQDSMLGQLSDSIQSLDERVRRSSSFNQVLEQLDRVLTMHLGRWIISALPSSEWVFRAAGGVDIAKKIDDWGKDMTQGGTLNELVHSRVRANPDLQRELRDFIAKASEFNNDDFAGVVTPHVAQAKALLAEPVSAPKVKFDSMLLNNLWSPEMVAAHAIAASSGDST